jgi:branched-chain amino acid transport system permease protein
MSDTTPSSTGAGAQRDRVLDSRIVLCVPVPLRYLIMTDIVRLGLFALSLDLILGYAGVSLGHAAFFSVGAYCAGLLALHRHRPVIALVVAGLVATAVGFLTSFLVIRVDLTRLMVTLGIACCWRRWRALFNITAAPTGCKASRCSRSSACSRSTCWQGRFLLQSWRAVRAVPAGAADRALAVRPVASRYPKQPLRAAAMASPSQRLIAVYTLTAFYAGIAARCLQTTAGLARRVLVRRSAGDAGAGDRWHRLSHGGLIGAVVFKMLQEVFRPSRAILAILDRPRAGRDRAGRPPGIAGLCGCQIVIGNSQDTKLWLWFPRGAS